MLQIKDDVVVITGGNSGIGYAVAQEFLKRGAEVIITGRRPQAVEEASASLGAKGYVADQGSVDSINELVSLIKKRHGYVDTLIINAAIANNTLIKDVTEEEFDRINNVNYRGAFFTLSKFIPILCTGASVIFISSIGASFGQLGGAVYASSKAAVNSLVKTAAIELAPRQIRVNAVSPGPIDTSLVKKSSQSEIEREILQKRIPLGRLGKGDDVAKLIAFLGSKQAKFITGADYLIDGGTSINTII